MIFREVKLLDRESLVSISAWESSFGNLVRVFGVDFYFVVCIYVGVAYRL